MSIPVGLFFVLTQAASLPGCGDMSVLIAGVERHFEEGKLEVATTEAEEALTCTNASTKERVMLHLGLSKIHDRKGLHNNSRPVDAALSSIQSASELADPADLWSRAAIDLAKARFYYRAEKPESDYPTSRAFARTALALFEELGDLHGQADIVHLTGLFHLQRQELDKARDYFERSLVLETRSEKARPIMLADYDRHMGFVYQLSGDLEQAIQKFEQSLAIRRDNGLTDQAMFAATSLGRALILDGRAEEAEAPLNLALETAEALDSPGGRARAQLALGQMHDQLGNREGAIEAFQSALAAAEGINRTSIVELASAALSRLLETR